MLALMIPDQGTPFFEDIDGQFRHGIVSFPVALEHRSLSFRATSFKWSSGFHKRGRLLFDVYEEMTDLELEKVRGDALTMERFTKSVLLKHGVDVSPEVVKSLKRLLEYFGHNERTQDIWKL